MGCSLKTGSGAHFFYSTSTTVNTALTSSNGAGPVPSNSTSWRLLSIAPFSYSRPSVIDSSLLSTVFEELLPGDLYAIEPVVAQVLWDQTSGYVAGPPVTGEYLFDSNNAVLNDCVGSFYLFMPNWLTATGETGVYLAGSGFVVDIQHPNLQNNERQIGGLAFQFDGKSEPAWYTHTVA